MLWKKKQSSNESASDVAKLTWEPAATQALEQAVSQAPVPGMLKGKVKKELAQAAEEHSRQQGHTTVTAEDLMNGLMAKMPEDMKAKVEKALKQGPAGLENLKNDLGA